MSVDHAECIGVLKREAAKLGLDIEVSSVGPLDTPYDTDPFVYPHGITYWIEPTGEQIAYWVERKVP